MKGAGIAPSSSISSRSPRGFNVGIPTAWLGGALATASLSLALLLAGVGSVMPAGGFTVAILTIVPVALAATVAGTVNIMTAPTFIVTRALMFPEPVGEPHAVVTTPPLPALLTAHVQLPRVRPEGATSVTVAPVTSAGPLLVTVMV